jgi:hypothetical protein
MQSKDSVKANVLVIFSSVSSTTVRLIAHVSTASQLFDVDPFFSMRYWGQVRWLVIKSLTVVGKLRDIRKFTIGDGYFLTPGV